MSLPSYLHFLNTRQTIHQMKIAADLARRAFAQETVSGDLVDKLRGHLLRTLDKLLQHKAASSGIFFTLKHYAYGFFANTQTFYNLEQLPAKEIQALENTLVIALQGLAKYYPVNKIDPIDFEQINEDEVYFLSLKGRKYRFETLLEWIKVRQAFIYPDDNSEFYIQDSDRFKQLCIEHRISWEPKLYSMALQESIRAAGFSVDILEELTVPYLHQNHIEVLIMLTTHEGLSERQAIEELQGLNDEQADALNKLYAQNLRGHHLRNLSIDESEYGPHHTVVLQMLVNEWHYDIEAAVHAISDCDFGEIQKFYSIPVTDHGYMSPPRV